MRLRCIKERVGVKMKKYTKAIVILFVSILSIICFPSYASAEEDLLITNWVVDAYLEDNGDLRISENISFEFNDKFNGVYRDILLNKTSGITDVEVAMVDDKSLSSLEKVAKAKNGDDGVYTLEEKDNKIVIKIFSPSKDELKTFRLSYIVKNVAVKYKDTGELYYKFLGDENDTPIGSFLVNIHFSQDNKDNKIRVYAHGPLNGRIDKVNSKLYRLMVDNVAPKTFIEGRLLFPLEFISASNNIVNIDRYQESIDEEEAYQDKLLQDRQRREDNKRIIEKIGIAVSSISVVAFAIVLYQCKRNINKETFNMDYRYSDIPNDISPAVAAYISGMFVNSNVIFSTILDLFRRGYIRIRSENEELDIEENDNFIIHKIGDEYISLLDHESYFMGWLFDHMGNGNEVSTDDIKLYSKQNWQDFNSSQNAWKKKVKDEADRNGYIDHSKKSQGGLLILLSFISIALGITTIVFGSLYAILNFILATVLMIYGIYLYNRLSDKGYVEYKKWMGFKKYVKKYYPELSKEEALESLDPSLIYGLALNVVSEKVIKSDYDGAYSTNSWVFWYIIFASGSNNSFNRSINNSFAGASSSTGGSFSGGGGGGAGGGGAGGF